MKTTCFVTYFAGVAVCIVNGAAISMCCRSQSQCAMTSLSFILLFCFSFPSFCSDRSITTTIWDVWDRLGLMADLSPPVIISPFLQTHSSIIIIWGSTSCVPRCLLHVYQLSPELLTPNMTSCVPRLVRNCISCIERYWYTKCPTTGRFLHNFIVRYFIHNYMHTYRIVE